MTEQQYSQLQRELGFLDGLSFMMPDDIREKHSDSLDRIDEILTDIMTENSVLSQK